MNKEEFKTFLKYNYACEHSYAETDGKSLQEWVTSTERADWLIWLWVKINKPKKYSKKHKKLLKATTYCAGTVRHLMHEKSQEALDVFVTFSEGNATKDEFAAAAAAATATASASASAYASYSAASYSAAAAASASYAAASASYAATAASADDANTRLSHIERMAPAVKRILFPEY